MASTKLHKLIVMFISSLVFVATAWAGTPFTSARNGLWDASDADTWGQGAGVYPQTTGDVVNIGHAVTFNVLFDPAAVALGQVTVNSGGILTFARDKNTYLPLGNQELQINNGGIVKVGEDGAIIPSSYRATLSWATTADNTKGINLAAGGKLYAAGDPAYFGSDYDTVLAQDGDGGSYLYTLEDMSSKWKIGQELVIHKGTTYADVVTDFLAGVGGVGLPTIQSFAGGNKINLDVAVPNTFKAGGDVLNVSRNVIFTKYGAVTTPGNNNANRPRMANANVVVATIPVILHDVAMIGWYKAGAQQIDFSGVIRNGYYGFQSILRSAVNALMFSTAYPYYTIINSTLAGKACSATYAIYLQYGGFSNVEIFGCTYAGTFFDTEMAGNIYANSNGPGLLNTSFRGNLGYDGGSRRKANTYDLNFNLINRNSARIINSKVATPVVINGVGIYSNTARMGFEAYNQVTGDSYLIDNSGDLARVLADGGADRPGQRTGGFSHLCEVAPRNICNTMAYLDILNCRIWAQAGVSKTYRLYLQSTYLTLPTAELKLQIDYLDQISGGHRATILSTQDITTRANQNDWSQYVEVTVNPSQDGYLNLYLRLMGYESGMKVWVDPMVVVAGRSYDVHWSYGEVQIRPRMATYPPSPTPR